MDFLSNWVKPQWFPSQEKRFISSFCWKYQWDSVSLYLYQSRFWVNKTLNILSLCLQSFEALNFYKFLDTFENREGFKLDFKIFSLILKNKNIFNGKIILFSSSQFFFILIWRVIRLEIVVGILLAASKAILAHSAS